MGDAEGAGVDTPRIQHKGVVKAVSHMTTWQACGLWALVLVVFLGVVPRLFKLRRRQRSGMRSE